MKYQKSMLKIYEELVRQPLKEFIIEEIIKEAGVGRTSGFEAIRWLKDNNLIRIKTVGKQKFIKLLINDAALNFKFFLNSMEIKKLPTDILFQINLFVYLVYGREEIESILLFGSAATFIKYPNDIDLLIVYKGNKNLVSAELKNKRKLIENISDITINFHFIDKPDYHDLLNKIVVYNKSYYSNFFKEKDKLSNLKIHYREALYRIDSIINNINDNALLKELIQAAVINLAYCYGMVEKKIMQTKDGTIELFMKKYKKEMKNFDKLKNIEKFTILKKIANEIGQKIFT